MNTVTTDYGTLVGVTGYDTYFDGSVNECVVDQENEIETEYGTFIPQYSVIDSEMNRSKKRRSSVSFYDNGVVKSIALEKQTRVMTAIGEFPAELVTFHKNGKLNRLFPLNGQINGFWSEEDEATLCETFKFSFPFGSFEAKIIGLRFYESGNIKSITLWPGEMIAIKTPKGIIQTKAGISFYENGSIKSVEPGVKTMIGTPIGYINAFDNDVIGIHGDDNSLKFGKDGAVEGVTTVFDRIIVTHGNGKVIVIEPEEVESYVDINETMILPIKLAFDHEYMMVLGRKSFRFSLKGHSFKIKNSELGRLGCGGMCSSCSSC